MPELMPPDRESLLEESPNPVIIFIDAVRHGGSRVSVELMEAGDRSFVSVIDDGSSAPSAAEERIFDELRSANDRGASGGMGLGLAVARQQASRMNGDLSYRRSDGETVFTLDLPSGRS